MIDALIQNGVAFTLVIQAATSSLASLWEGISQLGTTEFYLLVMPLIYWCVDRAFGIRLAVMLLLSAGLNNVLKLAWHLPRPYWVEGRIQGYWYEPTFGAPSGHAQTPLGLWGLAAATVKRGWFTALAVIVVLAIGFSRIALGAHFHFDVLSGWLLGALTLWLFLKYEGPVADWLKRKSPAQQILFALTVSLGLVALGALAAGNAARIGLPPAWEANAVADLGESLAPVTGLSELITPMGALFGFAVGLVWLRGQGGFDTAGTRGQKTLRFLLGGIVVVAIWMGLGAIFPRQQDLLSYSLRYLRYALVGFWAAGGAPWLFVRVRLAKQG